MFLFACAGRLYPDVIRMRDGKIYFGKVMTADSSGLTFEVTGKKITVDQSDILKTESDYTSFQNQQVEVILKDGSVIKGKIKDYDEEVGFLVDIEFGSLTVPRESLEVIEDPVQRNYYNGFPVHLGLVGGYYFTAGELGKSFDRNFNFSLFAEFKTNLIRGLFAGIDASYYFIDYTPSANFSYKIVTVVPYGMYRVLALRSSTSFIRNLVPHVSIGTGLAYVSVHDKRADVFPQKYGEMDFAFSPAAGIDYFVTEQVLVRLKGGWLLIPQKSSSLNVITVNLGGAYCF